VINHELRPDKHATYRSRLAALWALENFLDGVQDMAQSPNSQKEAQRQIKRLATGSPGDQNLIRELVLRLENALDAPGADERERQFLRDRAVQAALKIVPLLRGTDAEIDPEWLLEPVRERVRQAVKRWESGTTDSQGGGSFVGRIPWLLSPELFHHALRLRERDRLKIEGNSASGEFLPTEFAVATITHPNFQWQPEGVIPEGREMFHDVASISAQAQSQLVAAIEKQLKEIEKHTEQAGGMSMYGSMSDSDMYGGAMPGGPGGGGQPAEVSQLAAGPRKGFWETALPYYAKHTKEPAESLDLLNSLRDAADEADSTTASGKFAILDKAIGILWQRVGEQYGK
jgi:hypothetical protein